MGPREQEDYLKSLTDQAGIRLLEIRDEFNRGYVHITFSDMCGVCYWTHTVRWPDLMHMTYPSELLKEVVYSASNHINQWLEEHGDPEPPEPKPKTIKFNRYPKMMFFDEVANYEMPKDLQKEPRYIPLYPRKEDKQTRQQKDVKKGDK